MGNSISPCFQPNPRSSVKLIFWEGNTRILTGKHIAGEVMFEFPDKMVCHADSFFIGHPIPSLAIDDDLIAGQTYFVLPIDRFACNVLSTSFLASLNPSPKPAAPINFGDCPFEYVKGSNGSVLIKVVPEFITRLIHRSQGEEIGNPGNSFLCSTPELKKQYDMLVGSKEQVWSPKLETISEHKIRRFASPYIMGKSRSIRNCEIVTQDTEDTQQDAPQQPSLSEQSKKSRTRGRNKMIDVWNLPPGKKIKVCFNKKGQPIRCEARLLSSCLGILARNGYLLPLVYKTWKDVPKMFKTDSLNHIKEKFVFPDRHTGWILKSLSKKWRDYKAELKAKYFHSDNEEELLQNKPSDVLRDQWATLVAYWLSPEGKALAKLNSDRRAKRTMLHTTGSKSFASLVDEKEKLKEVLSQRSSNLEQSGETSSSIDEVFIEVMGKERPGRVRGLGLGPTPTEIWGLSSRHFQAMNDRDEEVLKLQEKLDAMTNKVSNLEEKAAKVSELEEKVSKMDELEATLATLKKVNVELVKFANAMQRRFPHVPSMDISSASLAVGNRQVSDASSSFGSLRANT